MNQKRDAGRQADAGEASPGKRENVSGEGKETAAKRGIEMSDGRIFEGAPVEVVQAMQALAWGVANLSLPEYIEWAVENAHKFNAIEMRVARAGDEEMAASFVEEMIRVGLARRT